MKWMKSEKVISCSVHTWGAFNFWLAWFCFICEKVSFTFWEKIVWSKFGQIGLIKCLVSNQFNISLPFSLKKSPKLAHLSCFSDSLTHPETVEWWIPNFLAVSLKVWSTANFRTSSLNLLRLSSPFFLWMAITVSCCFVPLLAACPPSFPPDFSSSCLLQLLVVDSLCALHSTVFRVSRAPCNNFSC